MSNVKPKPPPPNPRGRDDKNRDSKKTARKTSSTSGRNGAMVKKLQDQCVASEEEVKAVRMIASDVDHWADDNYTDVESLCLLVAHPADVKRLRLSHPQFMYRRDSGLRFMIGSRSHVDFIISLYYHMLDNNYVMIESDFDQSLFIDIPTDEIIRSTISIGPSEADYFIMTSKTHVFNHKVTDPGHLQIISDASICSTFDVIDNKISTTIYVYHCNDKLDSDERQVKFKLFASMLRLRLSTIPHTSQGSIGYISGLKWVAKSIGLDYERNIDKLTSIAQMVWDTNEPALDLKPDIIAEVSKGGLNAKTFVSLFSKNAFDDCLEGSFATSVRKYFSTAFERVHAKISEYPFYDKMVNHLADYTDEKIEYAPFDHEWLGGALGGLFSIGDVIYQRCYYGEGDKKSTDTVDIDVNWSAPVSNRCEHKPYAIEMLPRIPAKIDIPGPCICHAVASCDTRCLDKSLPDFDVEGYRLACKTFFDNIDYSLLQDFPLPDVHDWINGTTWSGSQKKTAHEVWDEFNLLEERWDGSAQSFSKVEVFLNKEAINPRFIQGRLLLWVLLTGPIIKAYKMRLKGYTSNPHSFSCVANTMTSEDVGMWVTIQLENSKNLKASDGTSYDSTHRHLGRAIFHSFLHDVVPEMSPMSDHALRDAWYVRGNMLRGVIKFMAEQDHPFTDSSHVPEGSGDTRTSDENSFLRTIDSIYEFQPFGVISSIVAGDDNIVSTIQPADDFTIVQRGQMIGRIEKPAESGRDVVFLQKFFIRALVEREEGWTEQYVPVPRFGRIFSKIGLIKTSISKKKRAGTVSGILKGHVANYGWLPILGDYCASMLKNYDGVRPYYPDLYNEYKSQPFFYDVELSSNSLSDIANHYRVEVGILLDCVRYMRDLPIETKDLEHPFLDWAFIHDVGEHVQPEVLDRRASYFSIFGLLWAFTIGPWVEEFMKSSSIFWLLLISYSESRIDCLRPLALGRFFYRFVVHYWLTTIWPESLLWGGLHHWCLNVFLIVFHKDLASVASRLIRKLVKLSRRPMLISRDLVRDPHALRDYLFQLYFNPYQTCFMSLEWCLCFFAGMLQDLTPNRPLQSLMGVFTAWDVRMPPLFSPCVDGALGLEHRPKAAALFSAIPDCLAAHKHRITGSSTQIETNAGVRASLLVERHNHDTPKNTITRVTSTRRPQTRSTRQVTSISRRVTPKTRRTRNRRRARPMPHPYTIVKVNPFHPACTGLRCPDEFGAPTATAVLRGSQNKTQYMSTGCFSSAFSPIPQFMFYDSASISGTTTTWAGGTMNTYPQFTSLSNLSTICRSGGGGLRITCDSSLTSSQGHIWVAQLPLDNITNAPFLDWPVTEALIASVPMSEKFSLVELSEEPLIIPFRAFDDGSFRFRDSSTTSFGSTGLLNESTFGWFVPVIMGFGIGSSTVNIEVLTHVEYIQSSGSTYNFIDAIPCPYDPMEIRSASLVACNAPVGFMERAVGAMDGVSSKINAIVSSSSRLINAVSNASQLAGYAASARGFFRSARNNAVPRIAY